MLRSDGKCSKYRVTYNEPGHAHELTFCCYRRLPLLGKERTRHWLIAALDNARRRLELELWAFCIMPDHVHVLLLPLRNDYDVAVILKTIKQPVAQRALNYLRARAPGFLTHLRVKRTDGRIEHRFWQQGGGYDRNIRKTATAWASVHYIHENPVRRGLVDRSEDWPWSSARWYVGRDDTLLAMDGCPAQLESTGGHGSEYRPMPPARGQVHAGTRDVTMRSWLWMAAQRSSSPRAATGMSTDPCHPPVVKCTLVRGTRRYAPGYGWLPSVARVHGRPRV